MVVEVVIVVLELGVGSVLVVHVNEYLLLFITALYNRAGITWLT